MRLRSGIFATLASGAIILLGWQVGDGSAQMSAPTPAKAASSATIQPPVSQASTGTDAGGSPTTAPAAPAGVADGTYKGSAINTPYGTVQVEAKIVGGSISNVVPLQLTDVGSLSIEIDRQAVPMLKSEVLSSQSANVNSISGATYTSEGYVTSLQAALDSAHFSS
ncbi:MAG: FMN-binding protein [Lacisediminihabitans sp.]